MKNLSILISGVFLTQSAFAGALADKAKWDAVEVKMKSSVDSAATPTYCGTKIAYTFDKASFSTPEALDVAHFCAEFIDGIGTFCYSNEKVKPEIVKEVKSVTCHYDPSLKSDTKHAVKIEKKGTSLTASFNKDSGNVSSETVAFLGETL